MNMLALCAAEKSVFVSEVRSSKVLLLRHKFYFIRSAQPVNLHDIQIADDLSLWTYGHLYEQDNKLQGG